MKTSRLVSMASIFLLATVVFTACKEKEVIYEYDKAATLYDVAQRNILADLTRFTHESDSLAHSIGQFLSQPSSANLASARAQFIATDLQWKACEVFDLGLVMDLHIHSRVGKWPTDAVLIDGKITGSDVMDSAYFEGLGATSRGLPAMEYLLFAQDEAATIALFSTDSFATRRSAYLGGLAGNLFAKARELQQIWSSSGENYASDFANSTASGLQDPMNMLVNALIGMLEETAKAKIGKPLGKFDLGSPQPDAVESPYANVSRELARANIATLQAIFVGGGTDSGIDAALDQLHANYGDGPLSAKITDQFAIVLARIDQITIPLQDALITQHNQVEDTYQALRDLLVLFKADLSSAMSITVTVSDSDGD